MPGVQDLSLRCIMTSFHPDTLVQDKNITRDIHRRFEGRRSAASLSRAARSTSETKYDYSRGAPAPTAPQSRVRMPLAWSISPPRNGASFHRDSAALSRSRLPCPLPSRSSRSQVVLSRTVVRRYLPCTTVHA
jgi:hypothetical protein